MGVFLPFVNEVNYSELAVDPSDRIFTPATGMTAMRPPLAGAAAYMLMNEMKGAIVPTLVMAGSDMEGKVARWIDKHYPESGLGTSNFGADWDPRADTMALLILSGGVLRAPRVTRTAKAATGLVLGQEGVKAAWAITSNHRYNSIKPEDAENLSKLLPVTKDGKEAMAEKFAAICCAVATNDFDNPYVRASLSAGAVAFASTGTLRGERVRNGYNMKLKEIMAGLENLPPSSVIDLRRPVTNQLLD